ncbi:MAG TPA: 30S ribosomal protein S9 [Dehalococcoidia bacterium]|nr:30S ribosomal protein S9 [Dehalococcoidia bacterium]
MASAQQPTYYYGTGGRKTATARVRLYPGRGEVIINGRPLAEYFPRLAMQSMVLEPLRVTNTVDQMTVMAKVAGGGISGQAGALRHGIARALTVFDNNLRPILRRYGSPYSLLTRDPRVRERMKVGLRRARKAPQYTKR